MMSFDAPSREECTAERTLSNIPQQALVLLNDPTYVESARVLAEKILGSNQKSVEERIILAYRHVLTRDPLATELKTVKALHDQHAEYYASHTTEAAELIATGHTPASESYSPAEIATWTSVTRVLLNLHETITRL